jgi:UDP-N-acetylglucosamine acyltransferase
VPIHPTAVIDENARVGDDCEIGPYCCVTGNVTIGDRCHLHSHVVLDGYLTIGDECEIFPFASLGTKTQDLKFEGDTSYVAIGNRTVIREYVTANAATVGAATTTIGDDCLIQAYCHIAHECILGNRVIVSSGAMLSGHVQIGDDAQIGGMTGVVQFVRVGAMAYVGGYSKLVQDVLPFCIADGIPAELRSVNKVKMQRRDMTAEQIRAVTSAFKTIVRAGKTVEEAVDELTRAFPHSAEVGAMLDFLQKSERGLARPRARKGSE